jgi:hypothetical protein
MANHSDDTSLAWVWSQYRGEQASGAKVEIIDVEEIGDVSTTAGRVPEDEPPANASSDDVESALREPALAPASSAGHASGATGPLLAALILTILGLLWFASSDKKTEATVDKGVRPDVSTGSPPAPAPAPPVSDSGQTAAPAPAAATPSANPTAPPPVGEGHPTRHRQRRHH